MATLKIMIGLPGSGKTNFAKSSLMGDNTKYLSSDDLRVELFGFEDQSQNELVFSKMQKRALEFLAEGYDVIYDATNLARKKREGLILNARKVGATTDAYLMCTPISLILERNVTRGTRFIPWSKLMSMIASIECPLYYEGFSNIYLINGGMDNDVYDFYPLMKQCVGFNQDNPYHTETLHTHIINVTNNVQFALGELLKKAKIKADGSGYSADTILEAAKYHDFGKLYTKNYNEKKEYCVYYGHEKVSTYLYLCHKMFSGMFSKVGEFVRLSYKNNAVASLILNHMEWYRREDMSVIKDRLGEYLFNMLTILHLADQDGSVPIEQEDDKYLEIGLTEPRKIKQLDIVFENCEVFSITPDMIIMCDFGNIYENIGINNFQYEDGEIYRDKCCKSFALAINQKGMSQTGGFELGSQTTLEDRLSYNDITHIDIIYKDGSNDYISVPWLDKDGSEFTNALQHNLYNQTFEGEEYMVIIIPDHQLTLGELEEEYGL